MASTALVIDKTQVILFEQFPELGVILVEEIVLANAQPVHLGALLELSDEFRLDVVIDRAFALVHALDGRREQADVGKVIGLVSADVKRVVTAHRQTGDSTVALCGAGAIVIVHPIHDVDETLFKLAVHPVLVPECGLHIALVAHI